MVGPDSRTAEAQDSRDRQQCGGRARDLHGGIWRHGGRGIAAVRQAPAPVHHVYTLRTGHGDSRIIA